MDETLVEKHIPALVRLLEPLVPPEDADGVPDEGIGEQDAPA
jgi:hypothetical protein